MQELEAALGPAAQENRVLLDMMRRGVRRIVRTADRPSRPGSVSETRSAVASALRSSELVRRSVSRRPRQKGAEDRVDVNMPTNPSTAMWTSGGWPLRSTSASNSIRHARESVR